MPDLVYERAKHDLLTFLTKEDLRVLLVGPGYKPSPSHRFVADVIEHEVKVAGYARRPLSERQVKASAKGLMGLAAAGIEWPELKRGAVVAGAVVHRHAGSDATSPLLAYLEIEETPTNGGSLRVEFPASGFLEL